MTSNRQRITDELVSNTQTDKAFIRIFDDGPSEGPHRRIPGFAIRINNKGTKTFIYDYRINNRKRQFTLGKFPGVRSKEARVKADEARRLVEQGIDPQEIRQHQRHGTTVHDLCRRYIEEHLFGLPEGEIAKKINLDGLNLEDLKPKQTRFIIDNLGGNLSFNTIQTQINMIRKDIIPEFGTMLASDIRPVHIKGFMRKMYKTPIMANRILSCLSKMFNLSIEWEVRENNPCAVVQKNKAGVREAYFSKEQMSDLFETLNQLQNHPKYEAAVAIIRIAFLTGARQGEIFKAETSHFVDDSSGALMWHKPSQNTKQRTFERVPVPDSVVKIIKQRQAIAKHKGSKYLFPHRTDAAKHVTTIKHAWQHIMYESGIKGITFHDIRRTFGTHLLEQEGKDKLHIISKLLGHKSIKTTQIYLGIEPETLRPGVDTMEKLIKSIESKE